MPTSSSKRLKRVSRRKPYVFFVLNFILLLAGCSQSPTYPPNPTTPTTPPESTQNLRPAGSPDVVVIGFAGRNCASGCDAPFSNKAYLDDIENQTLQGLKAAFESIGYKTEYQSYAAKVGRYLDYNRDDGYWQAQQRLNQIKRDWIADFDNPTRLVLVGHSNGTVWASLLAMENPDVTFDYGIYLDGVCNQWDEDNLEYGFWTSTNLIREFYTAIGQPYPKTLSILGKACEAYPVPGFGYQHIKDIVPWNVTWGLEFQANTALAVDNAPITTQGKCFGPITDWVGVKDKNDNMRPDGSLLGLHIERSISQDHCEIDEHDGVAMREAYSIIRANGLPGKD